MRIAIGVTGHRASHPSFPKDATALDAVLAQIFEQIDGAICAAPNAIMNIGAGTTRLVTLLADGTDHLAARLALGRGWELVTPLPFGRSLNAAINASPRSPADAAAMLKGEPVTDEEAKARNAAISALAEQAKLFELADDDERLSKIYLEAVRNPADPNAAGLFAAEAGKRAALAGRILIEQCDLIIAVWDGQSVANVGGTGHTVLAALEKHSPVLWIHPARPADWRILLSPEVHTGTAQPSERAKETKSLAQVVQQAVAVAPEPDGRIFAGVSAFDAGDWRDRSSLRSHAFRRIEAVFGETRWSEKFASIRQSYERPDDIAEGSARSLLKSIDMLSDTNDHLVSGINKQILVRFAWLDGISAHLSDRHRSGMTVNFLLGACAIIAGILYLPLVDVTHKWIFAAAELLLLLAIIANTATGRRLRLHSRWFETRRAAEYLRHSPMLAVMGVARPPGSWPKGTKSWWPEWYARHALRAVGLPETRIDKAYLRAAMTALRDHHINPQREYHRSKSKRLTKVHHGIDRLSERLFIGAILVVSLYLAMATFSHFGLIDADWLRKSAKWFTVLAVALPTLGGALAGIRYFGDFERFAEISEVTAGKLDAIAARIDSLLLAPDTAMTYDYAANIVHATDEVVFAEIQNWQAVFSGKIIAVPA